MPHRTGRLRTLAAALLTLSVALGGLATVASARVTVGVGDESSSMFSDPRFTHIHVRAARMTIPWNTMVTRNGLWRGRVKAWLAGAAQDHVTPLVSFGGDGNYIPSVATYRAAVKRFLRAYPRVRNYTAWNEPDFIYRSLSRNPRLAAAYYNTLVALCGRCTVAAGDAYLTAPQLGPWLRAYVGGLHHRPKAWALHPYDDVRGHVTAQVRTLMRYTSGAVWLDEIGGVERRGHWNFPYSQSPGHANNDERFLFGLPKRFHRITAIYHYQWQGTTASPWDSGLIGPTGSPRPAYYTFAAAVRGHLV